MYLANWEAVFLFLDLVTIFLCRSNDRGSPPAAQIPRSRRVQPLVGLRGGV